ncbi:MAG: hypothetical protein M3443_19285 [Actinomycetota bacterium]|nr:hypothetical protein [Actinomycetota bacterium]
MTSEGAALRVEPVAGSELGERAGRLVIPKTGSSLDSETVTRLRDADQK